MDFNTYKAALTEKAISNGYSVEYIERCLTYAEPLLTNKHPLIYNIEHFSQLVGYKKNYLTRAVLFSKYFYSEYKIKKANGGIRIINEPLPSLKEIQIWILQNILQSVPVSRYAKAYVKGNNLKSNLVFHRNQKFVLSLDIDNFFGSIQRSSIQIIFKRIGYNDLLANLFGKLCCLENALPQGAPTSPYLSNIYLLEFDEIIGNYCVKNKIRYSRYADDMTFSGNEIQKDDIIELVKLELLKLNLNLNINKTKFMLANQRQVVTGIVVNEKLQVPRVKREKIRQEIYFIKSKGLEDHLKFTKNERQNYLPHLLGQINFILFINPIDEEFINYKNYLKDQMGIF